MDRKNRNTDADRQARSESEWPPRWREKPAGEEVGAIQWLPGDPVKAGEMIGWLMAHGAEFRHPSGQGATTTLAIGTPGGERTAQAGDWIIREPLGGFRPCGRDVFTAKFEPAASGALAREQIARHGEDRYPTAWQQACKVSAGLRGLLSELDKAGFGAQDGEVNARIEAEYADLGLAYRELGGKLHLNAAEAEEVARECRRETRVEVEQYSRQVVNDDIKHGS